jgi:acetyl esterase/lipase
MLGVIGLVPRGSKPGAIQNVLASVVGATPAEQPELYRLLSPSQHVNGSCPPTLLLQGDDDVFGMSRDVDRLHQALCRAGAISVLVRFPHTDHAFDLPFPEISPVAQAAIYDVERFLALMASESGGSAGEDKRAASPAAAMPDATPAL